LCASCARKIAQLSLQRMWYWARQVWWVNVDFKPYLKSTPPLALLAPPPPIISSRLLFFLLDTALPARSVKLRVHTHLQFMAHDLDDGQTNYFLTLFLHAEHSIISSRNTTQDTIKYSDWATMTNNAAMTRLLLRTRLLCGSQPNRGRKQPRSIRLYIPRALRFRATSFTIDTPFVWLSSSSLSTAGWLTFSSLDPMGFLVENILENWLSGGCVATRSKRTGPTCITPINLRLLAFWLLEFCFWCFVSRHLSSYIVMSAWESNACFCLKEEGNRKCIHGWKNGKKGKKKTCFNNRQLCSCSLLVFTRRPWVV